MPSTFRSREPNIIGNTLIRRPQSETYQALCDYMASQDTEEREVGVVLPVGCGKSGCITIAPFAFKSFRTLVVAPNVAIAKQLASDFDPSNPNMFYQKCHILDSSPFPEPVKIRGTTCNRSDVDVADVVVTNIQQLQGGESNPWLSELPPDYFDLIIFDEGHHSVAASWTLLKSCFPSAYIVNFSATPLRADGQLMAGRVLYSYPVFDAIREGYVKSLKAVQLNPRTLRYVRREDGQEIEVSLEEVRRLGEEDADFRRSIVTSSATLNTIVDASIREMQRLRTETQENRIKIIASALNFEHCRQIVEAYRARGLRADYVHSRQDSTANDRVYAKLDNHQLDVIVQVKKLGEGFDHPFLSVAAVFSVFNNLSPFVQFVGRIMRVIRQNSPGDVLNQGVVIFHAGANIARQWTDFQQYSASDQEYFDLLLPLEGIDPNEDRDEREIIPVQRTENTVEVRSQSEVSLQEISLLENQEALAALQTLQRLGYSSEEVNSAYQTLQPVPTTRVRVRQAMRSGLDMRVRNEAGRILRERGINPEGRDLDRQRLGRSNLVLVKSAIDRKVNSLVGHQSGQRHDFSQEQLDTINQSFDTILEEVVREVFNGN